MKNMKQVKNLSLVGRLTINLASLNNEGTEGNATQPRTATVVQDGQLFSVPVISGDMLKHWHVQHLVNIAQERNLPLSENSNRRNPDPNRLKSELNKAEWVSENIPESNGMSGKLKPSEKQIVEEALYREIAKACLITDAHGLLITELSPKNEQNENQFSAGVAVARTSRIQVGFMVGVPDTSATRHYFHTKYVSTRTGIKSREGSANEGQNIFTRPATSADFAIVIHIDLSGLGFNDATNDYVISEDDRRARQKAVLDALSYTLMNQPGANTSQQFPHIMGFKGALVTSFNRLPAPTVSPIEPDFLNSLENLVKTANKISSNGDEESIQFTELSSLNEAIEKITEIGNFENS